MKHSRGFMKFNGSCIWLLISLLTLSLVAGCSPATTPSETTIASPSPTSEAASNFTSTEVIAALEQNLQDIYEQVNPSVVNIRVIQKEEVTFPSLPEIPGFPFFNFPEEPEEFYRQGLGSGFVWDEEGHIVTNNHVVEGADKISITFHDGTTVTGNVVATDPDSDLAVVKIDTSPERLQPVNMADSTKVEVGQLAVAIGNPYGLKGTMTVGFVSALGRLLPAETDTQTGSTYSIPDVIQTDAPINPGNSGGVLVDSNGKVMGVPSAIISPMRASSGIGLAIPSAIVNKVVPALIEKGEYDHPWLGISGMSLTPEINEAMGLEPDQRGALVVDVVPESPADKADLQGSDQQVTIYGQQVRVGGDVITAIDGNPVKDFGDLVTYLARSTAVGKTVTLTLLRDGEEKEVEVTLAARPESAEQTKEEQAEAGKAWLGILGMTVTPEIADAMNLPSDQQGVLIEQVFSGSPADEAGLRGSYKPVYIQGQRILIGGDIIIALEGELVSTIQELQSRLRGFQPGDKAELTILRDGEEVQVSVKLGEQPHQ